MNDKQEKYLEWMKRRNDEKLKVEIPDGYRWVQEGEVRGNAEWRNISQGKWIENRAWDKCFGNCNFITPIEPPKPPQDWLDKHGVELTGECRLVRAGDLYYSLAYSHVALCRYDHDELSGRYWILRKKEPPKPETVDVALETSYGMLRFHNPNERDGAMAWLASCAPCIVGPDWAFVGFVWDGPPNDQAQRHYYKIKATGVVYAKAVRFRRVGGAK